MGFLQYTPSSFNPTNIQCCIFLAYISVSVLCLLKIYLIFLRPCWNHQFFYSQVNLSTVWCSDRHVLLFRTVYRVFVTHNSSKSWLLRLHRRRKNTWQACIWQRSAAGTSRNMSHWINRLPRSANLILPDHILSCDLNRFDAVARDTHNLLVPLCVLRNDRYSIIDLQINKVILLDTADCDDRRRITRSSAVEHVFVFEKSL